MVSKDSKRDLGNNKQSADQHATLLLFVWNMVASPAKKTSNSKVNTSDI